MNIHAFLVFFWQFVSFVLTKQDCQLSLLYVSEKSYIKSVILFYSILENIWLQFMKISKNSTIRR